MLINCASCCVYLFCLIVSFPLPVVDSRRRNHRVLVCQEVELPSLPVFYPIADDGNLAFYRLPGSEPVPNVPVCRDPLPDIRILFTIPAINYSTILTLPTRRPPLTTTPISAFVPSHGHMGSAYYPMVNPNNRPVNGLNNLNSLPFLGNLINLSLDTVNDTHNAVASLSGNFKISVVQSNNHYPGGNLTADVGFNISQNFHLQPRVPSVAATAAGSNGSAATSNDPNQNSSQPAAASVPTRPVTDSPSQAVDSTTTLSNAPTEIFWTWRPNWDSSPLTQSTLSPPYNAPITVAPVINPVDTSTTTGASDWFVKPFTWNTETIPNPAASTTKPSTDTPKPTPIKRCPEPTSDMSLLSGPVQNGIVCGYFLDVANETVKNFCDDVTHKWDQYHATVPFMRTCCAAWILILKCDTISRPYQFSTSEPFTDFFTWNPVTPVPATGQTEDWNNGLLNEDYLLHIRDMDFVAPSLPPNVVQLFGSESALANPSAVAGTGMDENVADEITASRPALYGNNDVNAVHNNRWPVYSSNTDENSPGSVVNYDGSGNSVYSGSYDHNFRLRPGNPSLYRPPYAASVWRNPVNLWYANSRWDKPLM
ncbi:uncharacterized protein LOC129590150 [Paramacrobiotus metropolitanus]|uniref:uncharacterized protein LOC129590150 n=1 Tax=Paramacrobiotus metropolitanus TaxID=2943436 RepID=UPI00244579C8|nr:uncharacterized protein LOC129590150 [Paramacrobiotus metropolitanus]